MSSDSIIAAEGLSKAYFIYATPQHRLRQAVQPRLAALARRAGIPMEERRYYREHWALRDVSFQVRRGETVGIIGRNGAGKSTLLQLICGTLTPSAGTISTRGRVAALLELGSGFNPEYSGRDNILLNAGVLGLSEADARARLDDIIAFADIGDVLEQPVKTYSSGMAMRLAFSVAAHVDADVLVVDEALSVGDAYFQQKCMRWMRDFQKRGTLLFCGHDMGAVMGLCERAIWLDHGTVRMAGSARDVAEAYNLAIHAQSMGLPPEAVKARSDAEAAAPVEEAVADMDFSASASFGDGAGSILSVQLLDADGQPAAIVEGGSEVRLRVRARAKSDLSQVSLGFLVKDRLGQVLFLDNTIRSTLAKPVDVVAGQRLAAEFRFRMPALNNGDYMIGAAIASGTQDQHLMHHFVHDALAFRVMTPDSLGGVITVPLTSVTLGIVG